MGKLAGDCLLASKVSLMITFGLVLSSTTLASTVLLFCWMLTYGISPMMLAISSNLIILPVLSLGCVLAARQSLTCAMRNRPWYLPILLLWLRQLSGNEESIHQPHVSHLNMWGFAKYYSRGTLHLSSQGPRSA